MAETIRPSVRGRALGVIAGSYSVGYAIAAIAGTASLLLLPPNLAWRALFLLGVVPALLVAFVRRHVKESDVFKAGKAQRRDASAGQFMEIFAPPLLGRTLAAALLTAGALGGNYVMLTWLPTYLKVLHHLTVSNTGVYLFANIAGSFAGHMVSAHLSDAIGRKKTFLLMSFCSILTVLFYTLLPLNPLMVLLVGIPLGFFTSGIVTNIGAWFAEFYPTRMRGSGQGFTYNFGRAFGSLAPAVVGFASGSLNLGVAMAICAATAYGLVFVAALMLPETKGKVLAA
jgi:MFS family permease